jgi:hypothetical protein
LSTNNKRTLLVYSRALYKAKSPDPRINEISDISLALFEILSGVILSLLPTKKAWRLLGH